MHKIIKADVYAGLLSLEDNSIDVAITSPPYWGQRDYGFEGQIGNEKTYEEFIGKLTTIFNLLKNKLTSKGIFFLNIGDKYLPKYGNSQLGMIPFKLAYFMEKEGWVLNEILIWYKPNHMPSSVKNRFTNSYEPVFVFSKNEENYFSMKEQKSNILKVNLQPTPYKHVAVYPEKLVCKLIEMLSLPKKSLILDPFGGSGTTTKVVKENFRIENHSSILIECNSDYVEVIKKRCKLEDKIVIEKKFVPYKYSIVKEKGLGKNKLFEKFQINKLGFSKVFENQKEFYNFLAYFSSSEIKKILRKDSICFIGSKEFDIELLYKVSLLNHNDWVLRNMLVVKAENIWFPVFMFVDDNKKVKYKFNYRNLNLEHKNKSKPIFHKTNFLGFKVQNSLLKEKTQGVVTKVLEKYSNGYPKYVIVGWENGSFTKEFVIQSQEEINQNLKIFSNSKISVSEKESIIPINKEIKFDLNKVDLKPKNENGYKGKFKDEKKINRGASPGARAMLEEVYFSVQRLYQVEQPLVADYLNQKRIQKNLPKNKLTNLLPKNYKHTVGHWLRKDFGGSVPLPDDWKKLSEILEIDEDFTNYVCKTGLKIQTVQNGRYKMPEDFFEETFLSKLELLLPR